MTLKLMLATDIIAYCLMAIFIGVIAMYFIALLTHKIKSRF